MMTVKSSSRIGRHLLKNPLTYTWAQFTIAADIFFSDNGLHFFFFEKSRLEKAVNAEREQLRRIKRVRYQQQREWVTREENGGGSAQVVQSSWPLWAPSSSQSKQAGYNLICVTHATTRQTPPGAFWQYWFVNLQRTCFWNVQEGDCSLSLCAERHTRLPKPVCVAGLNSLRSTSLLQYFLWMIILAWACYLVEIYFNSPPHKRH